MSKVFKDIIMDYYYDEYNLFAKNEVEIKDGLTILVGCNGYGKSTLINIIKDNLRTQKIPYMEYDNLQNGGERARERSGFFEDFELLAQQLESSEGEEIAINISQHAMKMGEFVKQHKNDNELWFLFDAVDSGYSIDNSEEFKAFINNIVIGDNKNKKKVYVIISANSYEFARNENCLDVHELNYVTFKDYEEYREYILNTRKKKDNRYK